MTRTIARIALLVALTTLALAALVAAGPAQVWSTADAGGQWVVRHVAESRTLPERWVILGRRPDGGALHERAAVGQAPAQIAGYGSRLAILFDDGKWSIASSAGVASGPALPAGLKPIALASFEGTLFFLADRVASTSAPGTQSSTGPALLRFDGRSFETIADAPAAPAGTIGTRLLAARDQFVIARRGDDGVRLVARVDGAWTAPSDAIPADAAWLAVDDGNRGASLVVRNGTDWRVVPIARDGSLGTPVRVADAAAIGDREVAASIVAGELRLTWLEKDELIEQTFDAAGKAVGKPRRTAPGGAPGASATAFDRAMTILSITAVALVLLTSGRRGKEGQSDATAVEDAPPPAALGTRAVAGMIDAFPLCLAAAVVAATGPQTEAGSLSLAGAREQLILSAGVIVYIVISFACERLWGRTPGKALFGLRVVTLAGEPPTTAALLVRNGLRILDLNLVLLLLVPLTSLRQRLGDLLAGTMVIDDRAAAAGRTRKSSGEPADKTE